MRKISLFLMLMVASVVFYACNSEHDILPNNDSNSSEDVGYYSENSNLNTRPIRSNMVTNPITLLDGRLVFKTLSDYENALNSLNDNNLEDFEETYNFTSMRKYYADNPTIVSDSVLLDDELFPTMLNPDRVLQIGQYIFRIDEANDRIYLIREDDVEDYYDDLLTANPSNTPNSKVSTFRLDVNVLEFLQNGVENDPAILDGNIIDENKPTPTPEFLGWFCFDRRAKSRKAEFTASYSSDKEIHAFVRYRRYGIYFTIVGKSITREEGDSWPFYRLRTAAHNTRMLGAWQGRCWISRDGTVDDADGPVNTKKIVTRPFQSMASIKSYSISWYVKVPYSTDVRHLYIVSP